MQFVSVYTVANLSAGDKASGVKFCRKEIPHFLVDFGPEVPPLLSLSPPPPAYTCTSVHATTTVLVFLKPIFQQELQKASA